MSNAYIEYENMLGEHKIKSRMTVRNITFQSSKTGFSETVLPSL